MFLVFLSYFNVLMLKIIFKKSKNIINIYFNIKNYLKNNYNYPLQQARSRKRNTSKKAPRPNNILTNNILKEQMEGRREPFNGLVELTDGYGTADDGDLSMVLSGQKKK